MLTGAANIDGEFLGSIAMPMSVTAKLTPVWNI